MKGSLIVFVLHIIFIAGVFLLGAYVDLSSFNGGYAAMGAGIGFILISFTSAVLGIVLGLREHQKEKTFQSKVGTFGNVFVFIVLVTIVVTSVL